MNNLPKQTGSGLGGDIYASARDTQLTSNRTLGDRYANVKMRASELYDEAREKVAVGARSTDEAVHNHPYYAMAAAVGVGILIGILVTRGRSSDVYRY